MQSIYIILIGFMLTINKATSNESIGNINDNVYLLKIVNKPNTNNHRNQTFEFNRYRNSFKQISTENSSFLAIDTFTNESKRDDLKQKLEDLQYLVNLYYLPIIVSIGLIGNTLTIIILSKENKLAKFYNPNVSFRRNLKLYILKKQSSDHGTPTSASANDLKNRQSVLDKNRNATTYKPSVNQSSSQFTSTNYFIFSLAISDLSYNFILALLWITRMGFDILNINYMCQISVFVSYVCSFLSAAFTTLFTFQRFIAVVNPLRAATSFSLQSKRVIRRLIIILVALSFIIYSFSLILYDTEPKKDHEQSTVAKRACGPRENYTNLVYIIDNTLDSFLTLIVPMVGIIFMNLMICKSLTVYQKETILNEDRQARPKSPSDKTETKFHVNNIQSEKLLSIRENQFIEDQDEFNIVSIDQREISKTSTPTRNLESERKKSIQCSKMSIRTNRKSDTASQPSNQLDGKSNQAASRRITKTLLIVSFAFILLNSPFRASKLISYIHMSLKKSYQYSNFEFFINELLINLYFASYSVNFFLYSLCGKKFRASLKSLVFYCVFSCYYRVWLIFNLLFKRK